MSAREVLNVFSRLEMKIDEYKGLQTGHLKLAVVTTANYFAPRLLGQFCQAYPGVSVSLEVTNRQHIIERMNQNLDE